MVSGIVHLCNLKDRAMLIGAVPNDLPNQATGITAPPRTFGALLTVRM